MIRTTLRMRIHPGREQEFAEAWEKIALAASRTAGNIRQCLLRGNPGEFVITSDWTNREAFHAFERSPEQGSLTAPLRDLRRSVDMDIAEIVVHLESDLVDQAAHLSPAHLSPAEPGSAGKEVR